MKLTETLFGSKTINIRSKQMNTFAIKTDQITYEGCHTQFRNLCIFCEKNSLLKPPGKYRSGCDTVVLSIQPKNQMCSWWLQKKTPLLMKFDFVFSISFLAISFSATLNTFTSAQSESMRKVKKKTNSIDTPNRLRLKTGFRKIYSHQFEIIIQN